MDTTTQEMYERDDLLGRNKQRHPKSAADQTNHDVAPRRKRTEDLDDWL